MKVFFNGWFSGFLDRTNPGVHVDFFLELFKLVYNENCEIGDLNDSDILCEFDMLIDCFGTLLEHKKWKQTYLFNGESTMRCDPNKYDIVLCCERNHKNIVNMPLFIPYIYTNNFIGKLTEDKSVLNIPEDEVCVIISNPCGEIRNIFLNKLEQNFKVTYAGSYKNNISGNIPYDYNTPEFLKFISKFKFIISMENSRNDTYITEKIIHGLLANIIPVYWGSTRVFDYFNCERFLNLTDINDTTIIINKIYEILQDNNKFLEIVNKPNFNNNKLELDINEIANNIKNLIFKRNYSLISKIFTINSPEFEPDRHKQLNNLFLNLGLKDYNVKYICPTYKQTISDEIMNTHVKYNLIKRLRINGMKKSEISLFLNYRAILKNIIENYSDGLFLIFESDIFIDETTIKKLNEFIDFIYYKKENWDLIHIGKGGSDEYFTKPYCDCILPYRDKVFHLPETYIEDITTPNDKFRLVRKFHTRCTDSFIWNYKGVEKFYNYLCNNIYYDAPFDYYMINFLENNSENFKHYWSLDTFFIQGSNYGIYESTIQSE